MGVATNSWLQHCSRSNLRPGIEWLDFQKDDLLLCCSDGVWEFLSNVEALNIVSQVRLNEGKGKGQRVWSLKSLSGWQKEGDRGSADAWKWSVFTSFHCHDLSWICTGVSHISIAPCAPRHPDSTAKLRKLSTESRKLWLAESAPWLDFEKFHFSWQMSWLNTCLGDLGWLLRRYYGDSCLADLSADVESWIGMERTSSDPFINCIQLFYVIGFDLNDFPKI